MTDTPIRFEDGAAYERMMGKWSRLAGDVFIDWLKPAPGLRWVDVGCGNGAFTEVIFEHCAPAAIDGIDPSDAQLAFARTRPTAAMAKFQLGDAQVLPYDDASFDAAVMALVIFFVPDPSRAVAEMVRVVAPGGLVAAYAWDVLGGGFPLEPLHAELRALGLNPPKPPSVEASRLSTMSSLWRDAGLVDIETREITVERTFADFDDFWTTHLLGSSARAVIVAMPPDAVETLKARLRVNLPADAAGRITYPARANAIKGRVPA